LRNIPLCSAFFGVNLLYSKGVRGMQAH